MFKCYFCKFSTRSRKDYRYLKGIELKLIRKRFENCTENDEVCLKCYGKIERTVDKYLAERQLNTSREKRNPERSAVSTKISQSSRDDTGIATIIISDDESDVSTPSIIHSHRPIKIEESSTNVPPCRINTNNDKENNNAIVETERSSAEVRSKLKKRRKFKRIIDSDSIVILFDSERETEKGSKTLDAIHERETSKNSSDHELSETRTPNYVEFADLHQRSNKESSSTLISSSVNQSDPLEIIVSQVDSNDRQTRTRTSILFEDSDEEPVVRHDAPGSSAVANVQPIVKRRRNLEDIADPRLIPVYTGQITGG